MKTKTNKEKLIVVIFLILFSIKGYTKNKILPLKLLTPEKRIEITNPELTYPKFYFYYNQYKDFFVFGKRKAFYFVSKEGKLLKKYIVKNPQAPGGFSSTYGMFFYPDFFFLVDYCKVVKLNYNCTFLGNATNGLCLGMGLMWISQNSQKIIYFLHKEGFVLLKNNKKIAINKKLKLKTPWEDSSLMEFFRFYKCLYDETSNRFFAIHMGKYIIYILDPDSLKILTSRKISPTNFKMADDKKQGVYRMMGVEEYYNLLKGVCEVQTMGVDDKYLYVRWGERIGHQSFVDVFDKNSLRLLIEYKLPKTYREGNRVASFGNGFLYEDDIIEKDEEDIRVIKVYNVRKAVQRDIK